MRKPMRKARYGLRQAINAKNAGQNSCKSLLDRQESTIRLGGLSRPTEAAEVCGTSQKQAAIRARTENGAGSGYGVRGASGFAREPIRCAAGMQDANSLWPVVVCLLRRDTPRTGRVTCSRLSARQCLANHPIPRRSMDIAGAVSAVTTH